MSDSVKFGTVAYGDESIQRKCNPTRYLLGASVFSEGDDPSYYLRRAKPAGAQKLHWYDLDVRRQADCLEMLTHISQQTTIVAALPVVGNKDERARRKALEVLILRLQADGITKLVLESRNEAHDKRDRELLVSMRRKGEVFGFDLEHVSGKSEPLLWVPDQILGAYGEVVTKGVNKRWVSTWERLKDAIELVEIPTR